MGEESYALPMRDETVTSILAREDGQDVEPRRFLSLKDTARVLGDITVAEVRNRIDDGDLRSVKLGRRRMIVVASLDEYVQRLIDESDDPKPIAA
jgi:hypothetical protein